MNKKDVISLSYQKAKELQLSDDESNSVLSVLIEILKFTDNQTELFNFIAEQLDIYTEEKENEQEKPKSI